MNGVGISKIDDQFYKAVPATGMNVHVPIWLDGHKYMTKKMVNELGFNVNVEPQHDLSFLSHKHLLI